jgi:methylmalonyl-CoA carboxyltransferase large subunit
MARVTLAELAGTLAQLQAQMAEISKRIEVLEEGKSGPPAVTAAAVPAQPAVEAQAQPEPAPAGITEEELLAISAAIGAYLGVRAHIRQIRLLSTNAWAQQGRVSIQASHILQS